MNVRLKVLQGKPHGHFIRFAKGEFVFGRGPECQLRPNSEWVSRQHCLLHVGDSDVSIRDLGSTNGTLVNGRLLTGASTLHHGDVLQLGPLVLEVIVGAETLSDQAGSTAIVDPQAPEVHTSLPELGTDK